MYLPFHRPICSIPKEDIMVMYILFVFIRIQNKHVRTLQANRTGLSVSLCDLSAYEIEVNCGDALAREWTSEDLLGAVSILSWQKVPNSVAVLAGGIMASWKPSTDWKLDGTWHLSPRASSLLPCFRDFWTCTIPSLPNTWGVGRNPVVDTWVCLKIWYTERAINTKWWLTSGFVFQKNPLQGYSIGQRTDGHSDGNRLSCFIQITEDILKVKVTQTGDRFLPGWPWRRSGWRRSVVPHIRRGRVAPGCAHLGLRESERRGMDGFNGNW